jgi:hypothetical protein
MLAYGSRYCQCMIDEYVNESGSTKACCDMWENEGARGVKYSGTWADKVCPASFILQIL